MAATPPQRYNSACKILQYAPSDPQTLSNYSLMPTSSKTLSEVPGYVRQKPPRKWKQEIVSWKLYCENIFYICFVFSLSTVVSLYRVYTLFCVYSGLLSLNHKCELTIPICCTASARARHSLMERSLVKTIKASEPFNPVNRALLQEVIIFN